MQHEVCSLRVKFKALFDLAPVYLSSPLTTFPSTHSVLLGKEIGRMSQHTLTRTPSGPLLLLVSQPEYPLPSPIHDLLSPSRWHSSRNHPALSCTSPWSWSHSALSSSTTKPYVPAQVNTLWEQGPRVPQISPSSLSRSEELLRKGWLKGPLSLRPLQRALKHWTPGWPCPSNGRPSTYSFIQQMITARLVGARNCSQEYSVISCCYWNSHSNEGRKSILF